MTRVAPANRNQAQEQARARTEGHEQKQGLDLGHEQKQGLEQGHERKQWLEQAQAQKQKQKQEQKQEQKHEQKRAQAPEPEERTPERMLVAADRGSATIWVLAVGVVIVLVGVFGAALGAARMARQQARVAADFGALAGAGHALDGEAAACGTAGKLARANGARLAACRLDGLDVLVTTQVTVSPLPWLTRTVTATARAGPVRG